MARSIVLCALYAFLFLGVTDATCTETGSCSSDEAEDASVLIQSTLEIDKDEDGPNAGVNTQVGPACPSDVAAEAEGFWKDYIETICRVSWDDHVPTKLKMDIINAESVLSAHGCHLESSLSDEAEVQGTLSVKVLPGTATDVDFSPDATSATLVTTEKQGLQQQT